MKRRSICDLMLSGFIGTLMALVLIGFITILHTFVEKAFETKPERQAKELTPGELVDKAMEIPGAIVISPHRDLIEMGLAVITENPEQCDITLTTGSPAIAVHAKKKWCVWELGYEYALNYHYKEECGAVKVWGNTNTFIISGSDYKLGFDAFKKCIDEGNK